MSDTIKGSIIGALITGIISLLIFFLGNFSTQSTIEEKTVETLSGYFDSVKKDMSYEQAIQAIYKENESLKVQIDTLNNQLNNQNSEEKINKIVQDATNYANSSDYIQALLTLNNAEYKTSEMEVLITEYSQKYEDSIIEQSDYLKNEERLDEAYNLIKDALDILPNSQILKNKLQEIESSYPQNMVDAIPAYQSGGNSYTEYSSTKSGASEYFTMGGVKYTNGMTFNADINIFDDVSWAVYNLDKRYSSLEFMLGHVDGSDLGSETFLEVYYDGELIEEISVTPDMLPKAVSLNLSGVSQLKMQVRSSGSNGPLYGLGNPLVR